MNIDWRDVELEDDDGETRICTLPFQALQPDGKVHWQDVILTIDEWEYMEWSAITLDDCKEDYSKSEFLYFLDIFHRTGKKAYYYLAPLTSQEELNDSNTWGPSVDQVDWKEFEEVFAKYKAMNFEHKILDMSEQGN